MKSDQEKMQAIKKLEEMASDILKLKQERELRRPILIEFCGTPKSGKTTTITALNLFFKRNGFKTKVLTERASVCPIPSKTHPFFNLWTLSSTVAETVEQLLLGRDKVDIIISDRGIFDALCWFTWLNKNPDIHNPYLDDSNYDSIKNFTLMETWVNHLDLIYVFKVSPETSLHREYANLLTRQSGSIMNERIIDSFNKAIDLVVDKHGDRFRGIENIDTTADDPDTVSYKVTSSILGILHDMLIEKVGFIDHSFVSNLKEGINESSVLKNQNLRFDKRDIVESGNHIQPVAIAVITNKEKNKVLVVKKSPSRTSKDSPESNKLLLYIGGHVREEDDTKGDIFNILRNTLHREIQEEIGESVSIKEVEPFLIFSEDKLKSKKHLAVCYVLNMDLENTKFKLISDEFIMKTGKSKSGHVLNITELVKGKDKFEYWSTSILNHVFNETINGTNDLFSQQY